LGFIVCAFAGWVREFRGFRGFSLLVQALLFALSPRQGRRAFPVCLVVLRGEFSLADWSRGFI